MTLPEREQMAAIQRVLDGDPEGFALLVTAFQESALRMAFAITGDRTAAADVVQEAFVSAFRHLATYDASRATFAAWFHGILRNAARNHLRHRKTRGRFSPQEADPVSEPPCPRRSPDEILELREQMGALHQALAALPETWRRAFILTEIEGLPYAEAAVMEGVPIGTIRSRVHRSRLLLREALAHSIPFTSHPVSE